jgi:peptidyl-tRNA hydrolase
VIECLSEGLLLTFNVVIDDDPKKHFAQILSKISVVRESKMKRALDEDRKEEWYDNLFPDSQQTIAMRCSDHCGCDLQLTRSASRASR